jgi:hypothetical protein
MALELFKASPLPNPPAEYDPQYFRQFLRTLEIYFAQLDSLTPNQASSYRASNFYGNGTGIITPKAQFTSSTSQTAASTTTAYAVSLTDTLYADRVSLVSGSRITFDTAGVYNVEYNIQLKNTRAHTEFANIWLRKGVTNLPLTNKRHGVLRDGQSAEPGHTVAAAKVMVTVAAGDYIEIMWAASNTSVSLEAIPVGTSPDVPTTPSAVVSVDFAVAV